MKMTREQVAKTIEDFVNGTSGKWDWDDFISIRLQDAELDAIRKKCVSVRDEFPPSDKSAILQRCWYAITARPGDHFTRRSWRLVTIDMIERSSGGNIGDFRKRGLI
jgi:hypothetical protein